MKEEENESKGENGEEGRRMKRVTKMGDRRGGLGRKLSEMKAGER